MRIIEKITLPGIWKGDLESKSCSTFIKNLTNLNPVGILPTFNFLPWGAKRLFTEENQINFKSSLRQDLLFFAKAQRLSRLPGRNEQKNH